MAPLALHPGHIGSSLGFEAQTRKSSAWVVLWPKPLKPHSSCSPKHDSPMFWGKPVKPSWCGYVSDLPPSLDTFNSFMLPSHRPATQLAIIFSLDLAYTVFIILHVYSFSSMHHGNSPWLCLISSGPLVQAYSCSSWTLHLIFTLHYRLPCHTQHLHIMSQEIHHTTRLSITHRPRVTIIAPQI